MYSLILKENNHAITCEEASSARNIRLKQELKTILLNINNSFVATHLRSCDRLNVKKIKKIFNVKNITFMNENNLKKFDLEKGRVNPWNVEFCIYHIVCKKVFRNRFMATNAGAFNKGIYFKPQQLLKLDNLIIKDIGEYYNEYRTNCR